MKRPPLTCSLGGGAQEDAYFLHALPSKCQQHVSPKICKHGGVEVQTPDGLPNVVKLHCSMGSEQVLLHTASFKDAISNSIGC